MRVIFMGTPDFSVGTLEALIEAGHEVCPAVTQPDKPKGRGKEMQFPPVKEAALSHGIPVFQPIKVREAACVEELAGYKADVIVVVAFGQILPKAILELTPYGCVNVHASLLPKYRGAGPYKRRGGKGERHGEKISADFALVLVRGVRRFFAGCKKTLRQYIRSIKNVSKTLFVCCITRFTVIKYQQ